MQKLKMEVDSIAGYFLIMEQYLFTIDETIFNTFWRLKVGPRNNKEAVEEAKRIAAQRDVKLS